MSEQTLDQTMMKFAAETAGEEELEAAEALPPAERTAQTVALEIRTLQKQAQGIILAYAIEIGRKLEEAKAMLPHGAWGEWLKRELDYSPSTAQNFMRVYREYGDQQLSLFGAPKSQTFGNITYSKALKLLAIPDEEDRERFVSENDVEHMSVRDLNAAIRERDAARKDAEIARFEAENARNEVQQTKEEAARARENLAVREQSYMENLAAAEQAKKEAEKELEELRQELDARPMMEDKTAVSKARSEAIAEMNKKLQAVEAKRKKAEAESQAFADALKDLHKENEELKAKASAPRPVPVEDGRVKELEKQLAAAAPELAEFKVRFMTWQEEFQKLIDILQSVNDPTRAEQLRHAMQAALSLMNTKFEGATEYLAGDEREAEM